MFYSTTTSNIIKTTPFFEKFKPPKQLKNVLSVGMYINISQKIILIAFKKIVKLFKK